MSEALWRSSDKKNAKHKRRRARKKRVANYRVEYDLAYDGGGSAFEEYYRTKIGARISAFFHLHVRSWGGSADLYPFPMPTPIRHQGKKKK